MDVTVRPARPGEGRAVQQVRLATWRTAYAGIIAPSFLARLAVDDAAAAQAEERLAAPPPALTLVAEAAGRLVGMAALTATRDTDLDPASTTELAALYVLPEVWAGGVGSRLLTEGFALRPAPLHVLWVLEANTRARRFYAAHGFAADGARALLDLDGEVPEVRYRRSP